MTDIKITTTIDESLARIAEGICLVWQADKDTPAVYAEQCRVNHVDLLHSVVARTAAGQFIGLGILCRRGTRGFVLDFGVALVFRHLGLASRLMAALLEQIQAAHLHEVTLLVAVDNEPAIHIYEQAGFRRMRELVTLRGRWTAAVDGAPLAHEVQSDLFRRLVSWFGEIESGAVPWERDLPSLLALADVRAFATANSLLVTHPSPYFVQVDMVFVGLAPASASDELRALLNAAVQAYGPRTRFSLPEEQPDSLTVQLLASLGFGVVDRMIEMRLLL